MAIFFDTSTWTHDKGVQGHQVTTEEVGGEPPDVRNAEDQGDNAEAALTRMIEREIIPRLYLAHVGHPLAEQLPAKEKHEQPPNITDMDGFAALVLSSATEEILERLEVLLGRGMSLRQIYLELLAPVARRIGEFWEQDRCTFVDVTIGLSRLQQVLRALGQRNSERSVQPAPKHRAYLVAAPGEQHTFGISMVEELFLQAGWDADSDLAASTNRILQNVSTQRLDVIGFTVGCEEFLGRLLELIPKARRASLNKDVAVMVGGRLFKDHPTIASRFAASTTVISDGGMAVAKAADLVRPKIC